MNHCDTAKEAEKGSDQENGVERLLEKKKELFMHLASRSKLGRRRRNPEGHGQGRHWGFISSSDRVDTTLRHSRVASGLQVPTAWGAGTKFSLVLQVLLLLDLLLPDCMGWRWTVSSSMDVAGRDPR